MIDHHVPHIRMSQDHLAHVVPSWSGDSVGHYEGDTLVVDTVGVKAGPFSMIDRYGTRYTNALHVVERYRHIDYQIALEAEQRNEKLSGSAMGRFADFDNKGKGLQIQFTVEDNGAFTRPAVDASRSVDGIVTPPWTCGSSSGPVAKGMKKISYSGYRFQPEIIHQAIWLYLRFTLNFRDVEDFLAERGITVSYETIRRWVNYFGLMIAIPRSALSAALFERQIRPSSRNRVNAGQRLSM